MAASLAVAYLAIGQAGQANAQPGPASAQSGGVTLTITGMTPRYAQADSTITVSGTIANNTGAALSSLTVELYSSASPFLARSTMDAFISGAASAITTAQEGVPVAVKTIPAGGQAGWTASFTSAGAQMTSFGVYPVLAAVTDGSGLQRGADRTLLPFWQGGQAGFGKLKIAWAWPLIDQPRQQACAALTSDGLATSLDGGGRLGSLLTAGTSAQASAAKVTLVIDPALLTAVNTMTNRNGYQTGGSFDCRGARQHTVSQAAKAWLDTLKAAVASQPAEITPFANVDVAALAHNGMTDDVKAAYTLGGKYAGAVLGTPVMSDMYFPAGGQADLSVLTALAAAEPHVSRVVLGSGQMKLYPNGYREDALTSVHTMAGATLRVLLADNTISSVLASAGSGRPFAVEQRFLAETAMISAEAPESSRSVVISPPQTWDPPVKLAQALLRDTASVPWLRPASLAALSTAHDTGGDPRQPLASSKAGKRELTAAYLNRVRQEAESKDVYTSMLYPPGQAYNDMLDGALASCESSAWRGGNPGGRALVNRLSLYLQGAASKVKIITSPVVQMAGSAGSVPVSIQNKLLQQTIRVRLSVTVVPRPGTASPPLTVGQTRVVTVPPNESVPVTLSLRNAPQGTSTLQLRLVSADGTPTTVTKALMIDSTRYGRAILIVIAAAIGLLLLTSVFRSGMRARRRLTTGHDADAMDAKGEHEPADA